MVAVAETRQVLREGDSYRTYGYNDDILTFTPVDFVSYFPTFIQGDLATIPNGQDFSSTLNRYVSYYSNAVYTYANRYSISLSARKDGSNILGATTNNKWKPLWSSGLLWNVSKENFYNSSAIPDLRLRITYGFSGNMDPSQTAVTIINYIGNSPYTGTPYSFISNYYNPELRWEKVGMLNMGIDFKLKNDRITGSVEYYQKRATDLLGETPLDYTVGLDRMTLVKNVAKLDGSGWDISINTHNIENKQFQWQTTINFSTNRDKIRDYYSTTSVTNIARGVGLAGIKGRPIRGIYSYAWAGLDPQTGDPLGYLNGQASNNYNLLMGNDLKLEDIIYHGPALPTLFGTLGNTISWRGLSLSVSFLYKFGYYFRRPSVNYSNLMKSANGYGDYLERWRQPGDELHTSVPSFVYPNISARSAFYSYSSVLVEKGDHIRWQFLNMEYDFREQILKHLPVKDLKLYFYFNNIGIVWRANKHNVDPEYMTSSYPPSRSFSFGLKTNF
jgi:hypothetical protein